MEAPKCRLCEKRHYGSCADAITPAEPRTRRAAKGPARRVRNPHAQKKKVNPVEEPFSPEKKARILGLDKWPGSGVSRALFDEIMGRFESLESRVEVLEKRKKYNRDYMRDRRAEEKGDG